MAIIQGLQRDGSRPYADIAKEIGLEEGAVRKRVRDLMEHEVVQIVAVTDPLQLGFRQRAMVGIRTDGNPTTVARALSQFRDICYVVTTAGSADVLAEIVCGGDSELLDILTERIRALGGVRSVEMFVYLKQNKRRYQGER